MIKVIYGEKGTGKTKLMVDSANEISARKSGDVVFIDDSKQLIYDLKHEIRFINIREYPVNKPDELIGFICGILAQDYDVEAIFFDGLTYFLKESIENLQDFFMRLDGISEGYKVDFYISINGVREQMPEYLKNFV